MKFAYLIEPPFNYRTNEGVVTGCDVELAKVVLEHIGIDEFENYTDAANSALDGEMDAYASVGRAHTGYLDLHPELALEVVTIPSSDKAPAFGSFGFSLSNNELRAQVDDALDEYLGSDQHLSMMKNFGFTDDEVNLIMDAV